MLRPRLNQRVSGRPIHTIERCLLNAFNHRVDTKTGGSLMLMQQAATLVGYLVQGVADECAYQTHL